MDFEMVFPRDIAKAPTTLMDLEMDQPREMYLSSARKSHRLVLMKLMVVTMVVMISMACYWVPSTASQIEKASKQVDLTVPRKLMAPSMARYLSMVRYLVDLRDS